MNRENIRVYASLAEIVSALAIVVSLIYAAYEFRRSATLSSRDVDAILFERGLALNETLIQTPGLAEILIAADENPEVLSAADRLRYLAYQHNFFDSWELAWTYHADEILDDEAWNGWNEWYSSEARRRPGWAWVENRRNFTGAEFRQHVDGLLNVE